MTRRLASMRGTRLAHWLGAGAVFIGEACGLAFLIFAAWAVIEVFGMVRT